MTMETTLNKIRERGPCTLSWEKLLASLDKRQADDEPIRFKYLLDTLGIVDAIWCLRTLDYKEQCLFLADIAESMLPIFEKYRDDPAPRECIQAIRDYERGLIDETELQAAADAAAYAIYTAFAGFTPYTARGSFAAAFAAALSVNTTDVADRAAARTAKCDTWQGIEAFFIKHFVEK